MRKAICLCFAAALALSATAAAEEKAAGFQSTASMTYVSKYIWRGWDLAPNNNPAIQGSLTITAPCGTSLNIWGDYNLDSDAQLDELDFTVSRTLPLSPENDLTLGFIHYTFPSVVTATESQTESNEAYAGVSFPNVLLKPNVTLYYDWEQGDGIYLQAKGGTEFKISKDSTLPPVAATFSIGYNGGQWEPADDVTTAKDESNVTGVSDIGLTLSMAFQKGLFKITPSINYVIVPEENINADNEFWIGLDISTDI